MTEYHLLLNVLYISNEVCIPENLGTAKLMIIYQISNSISSSKFPHTRCHYITQKVA